MRLIIVMVSSDSPPNSRNVSSGLGVSSVLRVCCQMSANVATTALLLLLLFGSGTSSGETGEVERTAAGSVDTDRSGEGGRDTDDTGGVVDKGESFQCNP